MSLTPKELAQKAMELSAPDRAELADLLVASLGNQKASALDGAWLDEVKRRRDDVQAGRATTVLASDALNQVRDLLKQ
jgi:putative addiction module component (TIGR02574 family)